MAKIYISPRLKETITGRARGCCEYCRSQARFSTQSFSIEHIIPVNSGGETVSDNLALACQGCNNHKYTRTKNRDPVSGEIVYLFHPRKQQWQDHFSWNEDFTLIVGLTPTGRATIEALQLNREGLVNLRRVLYKMGEHPPIEQPGQTI